MRSPTSGAIDRHSLLTAAYGHVTRPSSFRFSGRRPGGRQCYMAGYWLMRNGMRGGWGPIASFTVPRGG